MSCVAAHPDPVIASPGISWVVDKSGGQIFLGWWTNLVDKFLLDGGQISQ